MDNKPDQPAVADAAQEKPGTHAPRRIWRTGCSILILALFALPAWHLIKSSRQNSSLEARLKERIAQAEEQGLAVTLPAFQRKYPVSPKGADAVDEAVRITAILQWDHSKLGRSPSVEAPSPPRTAFAVQDLITSNTGMARGTFSNEALERHVTDNSAALDAFTSLSRTTPLDNLGWAASFDQLPPFDQLKQEMMKAGESGLDYLRLRESTRVLLPAAVYHALDGEDPTRPYDIICGWARLSRSRKVSGARLVDALLGVALDGSWLQSARELLRASSVPDHETAWKLYDCLDPDRMRRDYLQGSEAEAIWSNQFLLALAGDVSSAPKQSGDAVREHKAAAWKQFRDSLNGFTGGLISPSPTLNWPEFGALKLVYPQVFARGDIYGAIKTNIEWVIRMRQLLHAPTRVEADRHCAEITLWVGSLPPNSVWAMSYPVFMRATMNVRGQLAAASVLRAATLIRIAELESTGTQTAMPLSLEAVCEQLGQPLPMDPMADLPDTPVEYIANPELGTYTIRHRPNASPYIGEVPQVFHGHWNPGGGAIPLPGPQDLSGQ